MLDTALESDFLSSGLKNDAFSQQKVNCANGPGVNIHDMISEILETGCGCHRGDAMAGKIVIIGFSIALCFCSIPAGLSQQNPAIRQPVPEQGLFSMLFRLVVPPQDSKRPGGAQALRRFKSSAQLTDDQVQAIVEVATAWSKETTILDERAREINSAARERAKATGSLPAPPPELMELQKQRDSIGERALVRLRGEIGDAAYERLAYALSHQNVNERGEDRASFSVSLPRELAMPAPPESRIERPDFKMPRESLYESKLPVKMMITPVGEDGTGERTQFRAGEEIFFKVTLLNTVTERQLLHVADVLSNYQLDGTKDGQRLPSPLLWVKLSLLPSFGDSPVIDIPYNVPLVIGTLSIVKRQQLDLSAGNYTFILQRDFALRPTINKEEEALYAEIGHFALKSNTVSITILP
jgi:hypothetical protein